MKTNKPWRTILALCFLLFSLGLFFLQIGYLFVPRLLSREVEYIHTLLFYWINCVCIISLAVSFLFYFNRSKKWLLTGGTAVTLFLALNGYFIYSTSQNVHSTLSFSPDGSNTLVLKQDIQKGEMIYYRDYYYILARPLQRLSTNNEKINVKWLANDIAAVTYQDSDQNTQQHIATYGDRGDGISYYDVGAQIHGEWQSGDTRVTSGPEGIYLEEDGQTHHFDWEHTQQYGTLALVLKDNEQAAWVIALADDFVAQLEAPASQPGHIVLYPSSLNEREAKSLEKTSD
ncbi:hypothetical protein [Alkalicoccobacillus gibsonii]|uniref:hypothetical protein n=1 Tax=Alkalicoccobacillus gibsonii TaxID=79881 RepID=UPI001934228F|nr:hypothetical protein [Alkalicoccobacillus gibsonii]MBM0066220.1 hypothetical protein [Alkalicoccobacillus gibsonii]